MCSWHPSTTQIGLQYIQPNSLTDRHAGTVQNTHQKKLTKHVARVVDSLLVGRSNMDDEEVEDAGGGQFFDHHELK